MGTRNIEESQPTGDYRTDRQLLLRGRDRQTDRDRNTERDTERDTERETQRGRNQMAYLIM